MSDRILLGYEVKTARTVEIPLHHTVITGVTQLSGKTTTLEALIRRSGLRSVAFRTKRGEGGFTEFRAIQPFFRERADWLFVEALLEASMRERMKFERGSIIRACKGARSLRQVQSNIRDQLPKARGINLEILQRLDAYFELVLPELERIPFSSELALSPGVNVIDLEGLRDELQALIVASVIQEVLDRETGIIVVVPEANEFIPQERSSPAKLPALRLARKGAAIGNYLWMDSQDIAGIDKDHLKQVGVWILGVQTEQNEVVRTLKHIPNVPKPNADEIRQLALGHFFACFRGQMRHVYVLPSWLDDQTAREIARGERAPETVSPGRVREESEAMWKQKYEEAKQELVRLEREHRQEMIALEGKIRELEGKLEKVGAIRQAGPPPASVALSTRASRSHPEAEGGADLAAIVARIRQELLRDPVALKIISTQPTIEVAVHHQVVEASEGDVKGRIALLLKKGFFDDPKGVGVLCSELKRRGFDTAPANLYKPMDWFALAGFVTKETVGGQVAYQAVPEMRKSIEERKN